MSARPLVSVILPVFDGEEYVGRAIASVLNQTWRKLELIVVDDASTDGTAAAVRKWMRRDRRIRFVSHARNQGENPTRNTGLGKARGRYVGWIDHDDEWIDRRKLALQVAFLEAHSDVVIVGCGVRIEDEAGRLLRIPVVAVSDSQIRNLMLFRNPFVQPAVLFRRSVLARSGPYEREPRLAGDYHLWLKTGRHGLMANLTRVMVRVTELPTGLTRRNYWSRYWAGVRLVWKFRNDYPHGRLALFKNLTERVFGFVYRPLKPLWVRMWK